MFEEAMKRLQQNVWDTLQTLGWAEVDHGVLALGNLTFEFIVDEQYSPGGALVRQYDSPWVPSLTESPRSPVKYHEIWLNHPTSIRRLFGNLTATAIVLQITHVVYSSLSVAGDIEQQTHHGALVATPERQAS